MGKEVLVRGVALSGCIVTVKRDILATLGQRNETATAFSGGRLCVASESFLRLKATHVHSLTIKYKSAQDTDTQIAHKSPQADTW